MSKQDSKMRNQVFVFTTGVIVIVLGFLFIGWVQEETETVGFDSVGAQVYEVCDITKAKRVSIIDDLNNFKGKNADGSLRSLNAKEVADLKGCEIAKLGSVPRTTVGNYDIEITSIEKKEKGITVYVRAWDANGQIGFGKDGTVDIERVNIMNPPIAYIDPNGIVISEYADEAGNIYQKKVIEDPKEALLRDLAHTISVKKQKHDSSKIVQGKIGSTTTTLNPDANPETSSVDGQVNSGEGATWDTQHDLLTGASANDTSTGGADTVRLMVTTLGGGNYLIVRGFVLFDGSAISGADTIDTAVLSFFGTGEAEVSDDAGDIDIVDATPASNTGLITADFDQAGAVDNPTVYASLLLSTWDQTDGTANDFTLDAAGEAKIATALDGDGILKFGVRSSRDSDDTAPTIENKVQSYWADQTGASIPKLVIEHTAGVVPVDDPSSPMIIIN